MQYNSVNLYHMEFLLRMEMKERSSLRPRGTRKARYLLKMDCSSRPFPWTRTSWLIQPWRRGLSRKMASSMRPSWSRFDLQIFRGLKNRMTFNVWQIQMWNLFALYLVSTLIAISQSESIPDILFCLSHAWISIAHRSTCQFQRVWRWGEVGGGKATKLKR